MPPTSSMAPANQYIENSAGEGSGEGQPNRRDVPCSRKSRAATMRTMLSTYGAYRSA